jgi:hexokinase
MAVDLGGTNFRVCSVRLNGDGTFNITSDKVPVPKELMVADTAEELFAFLAQQIKKFLEKHHGDQFKQHIRRRLTMSAPEGWKDESVFNMGFTFSFPVKQMGINKGTLIRWTKGFDIQDAVGRDVCALLQQEIDKLHLPVRVAALVNDTVGTLMAHSYGAPGSQGAVLGAIFGTGTNGAYVEKMDNVKKPLAEEYPTKPKQMVINTEWGSFDNQLNVLPNTPWDAALDKQSVNPGYQMYEKRVSGMFLGEILRLVINDLLKNPNISFLRDDNSSTNDLRSTTDIAEASPIYKQWGVDSSILSVAAGDHTPGLTLLRRGLDDNLQIHAAAYEDAQAVKAIADAIGRRAARLAAVAIAAIVIQSGKLTEGDGPIDVGVDGSLVEHYPYFREMIQEALSIVDGIGPEGAKRIRIGLAEDGSGVGAALIALVAANVESKNGDAKPDAAGALGEVRSTATTKGAPGGSAADDEKAASD